jgi:FtsZ-interacting cell division protein ZipA
MSTGLIIGIVVAVLILVVLFAVVLPRARRKAEVQSRERELNQRREHRAEEHRSEAAERRNEAEMAEQRARMAQAEAEKERAEAEMREQRAQMHERGMADDELIDESERDRFAGTSATTDEPARMRDEDERPMHEPTSDYEQGREDEAREDGRFNRAPEQAEDPTTRSGPTQR